MNGARSWRQVSSCEGGRVADGIAAHLEHDRHSTVRVRCACGREPPHRRVIKEQRLRHVLQQVHEVIVATDVGELCARISSTWSGQAGERGDGEEDDRTPPAHDCRRVHNHGFDDVHDAPHMQHAGETRARLPT